MVSRSNRLFAALDRLEPHLQLVNLSNRRSAKRLSIRDIVNSTPDQNRRVQVVDDNEDVLSAIKVSLEVLDFEVLVCKTGSDAIEQFEKFNPFLVIVDQGLPDIDGLEVGRGIRSSESAQPRLILLTGSDTRKLREQATEIGFDQFLVKPVGIESLSTTIESLKK